MVVVVTGSARGLGRDIALHFAKKGYIVVAHYYKSKKDARSLLKELQKYSPKSTIVSGDLRNEVDVAKVFKQIFSNHSRIDVLVNNVGNFLYKKLESTSNEEFRDVIESNIYSTFYCSREVLPSMRKKKSGHIINIGAAGGERFIFRNNVIPYFMAKNGVFVLTKAMASEEAANGISINMISPTSMKTDIFKKNEFPLGREAKSSDAIKAIDFLISDRAYYIKGANIEVAGGFIAGGK